MWTSTVFRDSFPSHLSNIFWSDRSFLASYSTEIPWICCTCWNSSAFMISSVTLILKSDFVKMGSSSAGEKLNYPNLWNRFPSLLLKRSSRTSSSWCNQFLDAHQLATKPYGKPMAQKYPRQKWLQHLKKGSKDSITKSWHQSFETIPFTWKKTCNRWHPMNHLDWKRRTFTITTSLQK